MVFLDTIKIFVKQNLPTNLSNTDLFHHFGASMSGLIEARLEEIERWLEDTDVKLKIFFKDYAFVAASDPFSISFNAIIDAQIAVWITDEDVLRARFNTYWDAYRQRLKTKDMLTMMAKNLEYLEEDIIRQTTKANFIVRKWIKVADADGLQIKDTQTKNIFKWFSDLNAETFKADYAGKRSEKIRLQKDYSIWDFFEDRP